MLKGEHRDLIFFSSISEKFGLFVMCIAQFITGYIVAFVNGPKLAGVMLAGVPLMVGTGITMGKLITKYTLKVQTSYALGGAVAEQVFAGLRTVYSFSLQERFTKLFEEKLVASRVMGFKRGIVTGMGMACFMTTLFFTYALALWWGSQLVNQGYFDGASGKFFKTTTLRRQWSLNNRISAYYIYVVDDGVICLASTVSKHVCSL